LPPNKAKSSLDTNPEKTLSSCSVVEVEVLLCLVEEVFFLEEVEVYLKDLLVEEVFFLVEVEVCLRLLKDLLEGEEVLLVQLNLAVLQEVFFLVEDLVLVEVSLSRYYLLVLQTERDKLLIHL